MKEKSLFFFYWEDSFSDWVQNKIFQSILVVGPGTQLDL